MKGLVTTGLLDEKGENGFEYLYVEIAKTDGARLRVGSDRVFLSTHSNPTPCDLLGPPGSWSGPIPIGAAT